MFTDISREYSFFTKDNQQGKRSSKSDTKNKLNEYNELVKRYRKKVFLLASNVFGCVSKTINAYLLQNNRFKAINSHKSIIIKVAKKGSRKNALLNRMKST